MTSPDKLLRSSYLGFDERDVDWLLVGGSAASRCLKATFATPYLAHSYDATLARCRAYASRTTSTYGVQHLLGIDVYDEARPVVELELNEPDAEAPASQSGSSGLRDEFERLKTAWLEKSQHMSVVADMVMLKEYQRIIGLGSPVLPLIIETLRTEGGHWFWALRSITGEDHAVDAKTVKEAKKRWIEWYESANELCGPRI